MGMAAGQARLLSITARLTDNENNGQALSYSKQRLADETESLNTAYLAALDATKLTVLTGFNGSIANYSDISYNLMTGFETVACGRQYIVTNAKGKILVTDKQAKAFEAGNGDFNIFLAELGYTQADIDNDTDDEAKAKIHEAWDKYFASVGITFEDEEHEEGKPSFEVGYESFGKDSLYGGYPTYTYDGQTKAINYEGSTTEQRELYDYAVAITTQFYSNGVYYNRDENGKETGARSTLQTANEVESGYIDYLRNIFNKMSTSGYYTEQNENDTIKDDAWFEQQIKEGKLLLQYYSSTDKAFVSTTISDDDSIQEVEDERQIALVEAEYNQQISALEKKDQKIDLELKKLDTEHNALQTEYESVKNVVDKNVEKSFSMFS